MSYNRISVIKGNLVFRSWLLFIIFSTLSFSCVSYADMLMRVETQQGASPVESFDIRLFDDVAPNTVSNFLNYANGTTVNGGSFNKAFFHRNARLASGEKFIIQTGGFIYDPFKGDFIYDAINEVFLGGLNEVTQDGSVVNEFQIPNTLGTLAMAKIGALYEDASGLRYTVPAAGRTLVPGTGPDSATSQWFINLNDNSAILDGQNGGFTVFGTVMGSGMVVVNSLEINTGIDKTDIHPHFSQLPLVNYATSDIVDETKLVKIISMNELAAITGDIDYGLQFTSTSSQKTITVLNKSPDSINIGPIRFENVPSLPFSIISGTNNCGTVLLEGESCLFILDFSPDIDGDYSNSININFPDLVVDYTLLVSGGSAPQIRPIISSSESMVDYGEVSLVLDPSSVLPEQIVVLVNNEGNTDLNISSATLSGDDVVFFEVFDNCKIVSPVAPGEHCVLPINLYALETGVKNASLTILSDDPDQPSLVIPIKAIVSEDTDGVSSDIEDQSGLLGDGNFDGIPDRLQSYVVSLKGEKNQNITLVAEPFVEYRNVIVNDSTSLISVPENINFDLGAIQFSVTNQFEIGNVDMGFILPANVKVSSVYFYSSTVDDSTKQWRVFDYDGTTGTKLITTTPYVMQDGNTVQRNVVLLSLEDGGRGDTDMLADGKINTLFAISVSGSDSSGAVDISQLVLILSILLCYRVRLIPTHEFSNL